MASDSEKANKVRFLPLGEGQKTLSVTKEDRAFVFINWMALPFYFGAGEKRSINKFYIRVAIALNFGG